MPNRRVGLLALHLTCGAYLAFADKDPRSPTLQTPLDDGTGSGPATAVSARTNRVRTTPAADCAIVRPTITETATPADPSTQAACR